MQKKLKVPLVPLPTIDTPWRRVAFDSRIPEEILTDNSAYFVGQLTEQLLMKLLGVETIHITHSLMACWNDGTECSKLLLKSYVEETRSGRKSCL